MKLIKRHCKILKKIAEFNGAYSQEWSRATCLYLQELGLIEGCHNGSSFVNAWRITAIGQETLNDPN